jgi:hypothetical protein
MNKKYFKEFCMGDPANLSEEECPTDEDFFKYFRSLTFAHPYDTHYNTTFRKIFGIQVSPWVIANKNTLFDYQCSEPIGVRLYSTRKTEDGDTHDIIISFSALKGFLVEKYNELSTVTGWIINDSKVTIENWKKEKVNRNQSPSDILRDIYRIQSLRHESLDDIWTLIEYMDITITNDDNKFVVNEYRTYLESLIPDLCDQVDSYDMEGVCDLENKALVFKPSGMHKMANYQLEKIYTALNERHSPARYGSNEEWALKQVENFSREFAYKWVTIDTRKIDYIEIKLLVTVSLFMECKSQGKLK